MTSTMKIDSISSNPDRAGRYSVRFSDGTVLRLYRQTIEDFSLFTGLELDKKQQKLLLDAAGAMSAKMRAVRIVAASSVSKSDLEHRLIMKGEDPNNAKDAVQWMSDLQLIDDVKTAEQIVRRCIGKGYGLSRAKQALFEKRIPKECWQEVLEDYPDQSDAIIAFLREHIADPSDQRIVKRTLDALIRRGHSYANIRQALEQLSIETGEFAEE